MRMRSAAVPSARWPWRGYGWTDGRMPTARVIGAWARRPSVYVRRRRCVGADWPSLRITPERLARDAPEPNAIGAAWRDLKRHHLALRTFPDAAGLDRAIQETMAETNGE